MPTKPKTRKTPAAQAIARHKAAQAALDAVPARCAGFCGGCARDGAAAVCYPEGSVLI
jgi:hypothetical protein